MCAVTLFRRSIHASPPSHRYSDCGTWATVAPKKPPKQIGSRFSLPTGVTVAVCAQVQSRRPPERGGAGRGNGGCVDPPPRMALVIPSARGGTRAYQALGHRAREDSMKQLWQRLWSDQSGQGMVEYALIVGLVAVGLIAVFLFLRNSTGDVLNTAADSLQNTPATPYATH